jgi:hypothetical protein
VVKKTRYTLIKCDYGFDLSGKGVSRHFGDNWKKINMNWKLYDIRDLLFILLGVRIVFQ